MPRSIQSVLLRASVMPSSSPLEQRPARELTRRAVTGALPYQRAVPLKGKRLTAAAFPVNATGPTNDPGRGRKGERGGLTRASGRLYRPVPLTRRAGPGKLDAVPGDPRMTLSSRVKQFVRPWVPARIRSLL